MEVSKLRFEPKEVVIIAGAVVAYFTQLNILIGKIDNNNHKSELKFQGFEYRITTLENLSKYAILPSSPKVPEKPKENDN
jgi:hypothetical protein